MEETQPELNEEALKAFIEGKATLGEVYGVDKESQYKVAELGYNLMTQGKLSEAKAIFEGLVAMDPKDTYFLTACGAAAQREEDLEDANKWYDLALEVDSKSAVALANRGEIKLIQGNIDEAISDLSAAIQADAEGTQPSTQRAAGLLQELKKEVSAALSQQ